MTASPCCVLMINGTTPGGHFWQGEITAGALSQWQPSGKVHPTGPWVLGGELPCSISSPRHDEQAQELTLVPAGLTGALTAF